MSSYLFMFLMLYSIIKIKKLSFFLIYHRYTTANLYSFYPKSSLLLNN